MKTDCEIIADLMPLYTDGICSEKSRALVEEHCTECKKCRGKLAAMTAPLPEITKAETAKDPLKKTRRHYIRLAVITAVICAAIALPLCRVLTISINEINKAQGESWSSIAMEREMTEFGRLIKNGNSEAALSKVGITALDGSKVFLGDSENADIRRGFAGIFESFAKQYPISKTECSSYFRNTVLEGELHIIPDESSVPAPVQIYIKFSRGEDGKNYITQAILDYYGNNGLYSNEDALREMWKEYGTFFIPDYPADHAINRLSDTVKSCSFRMAGDGGVIVTPKEQQFYRELEDIYSKYRIYIADGFDGYYTVDTDNEDCKAETAGWRARRDEYAADYQKRSKELFSEKYRLVSVKGERPYLVGEEFSYAFYGFNSTSCFRQKITLNMETLQGQAFWVSFDARAGTVIIAPFDSVEFSDSAPQEFIELFGELFG